MWNMKPCHDLCSNDFIEWLLTERIGTAFDQTAFAIYDLPTLFQEAVRGVIGRGEVQRIRLLGCAEQDVTDRALSEGFPVHRSERH